MMKIYLKLAGDKHIVRRALIVSLLVGVLLNMINKWDILFHFEFIQISAFKVFLTFLVPYLVSTYSSILAKVSLRPGDVSNLSANIQCAGCKGHVITLSKGEWIPFCEHCSGSTQWKIVELLENSSAINDEWYKSMALFAQYNPSPVFRVNFNGEVIGSNTAAKLQFGISEQDIVKVEHLAPDFDIALIQKCIVNSDVKNMLVHFQNKSFIFEVKGISENKIAQLYGSDVSELLMEKEKVKSMARFANLNPAPVLRVNKKGEILDANPVAKAILNKSDLIGKQVHNLIPEFKAFNFEKNNNSEEIEQVECEHNGGVYLYSIFQVKELEIYHFYGSDISNQKKAERKLESMAIFARLNPEPVFRFSRDLIIIDCNLAAKEAFGFIPGQMSDKVLHFINELDVVSLIGNNQKEIVTAPFGDYYYRFMIRGIAELDICQVYSSDITLQVLAEKKVREQAENIQSSIRYASRIQGALLPSKDKIDLLFPENFILYKPRDIVSGDFFWVTEVDSKIFLAAADCTGHGVPGAFMSMLGVSFLNQIVNGMVVDCTSDKILNMLRHQIIVSLSQNQNHEGLSDGMDIALCVIDKTERTLQYSGANNPLWFFRNNELVELKADHMPIGRHVYEDRPFNNQTISIEPQDVFYIFSDGYHDQLGGQEIKKMTKKVFRQKLADVHHMPFPEQKKILESHLNDWTNSYHQIDDVMVIGFKI